MNAAQHSARARLEFSFPGEELPQCALCIGWVLSALSPGEKVDLD